MRKVFGIGLNKTGISTLKQCFRVLGYTHKTHDRDLLVDYREGRMDRIETAMEAHDSFEAWPWGLMYREIFERYGREARYILTLRKTPDTWLTSLKNHSLQSNPDENSRYLAYGYDYPHGYEAEHLAIYRKHEADVRAFFAKHGASDCLKVLCWEKGDGWEDVCDFLGHDIPDRAFPHANKTANRLAQVDPERLARNQAAIEAQLKRIADGAGRALNRSRR